MPKPTPAAVEAESAALSIRAWRVLRAAAAAAKSAIALAGEDSAWLVRTEHGYGVAPGAPEGVRPLLELYAPLCSTHPLTVGHLGQSLDGYIATASGDSYYVTGPDNLRHLHRLRALAAAIVVGAGTVATDDPRLTVREVEGANPVRVVIDPGAKLDARRRVFTDREAPTLVVHAAGLGASAPGEAEILPVPLEAGRLRLDVLLERLHERGLTSVFVEGGGTTVSRFLEAGLLDRLHIAIAPLVMGRGRPGLALPARERIAQCLRPAHRVFTMGADVLFDCDLRAAAPVAAQQPSGALDRVV